MNERNQGKVVPFALSAYRLRRSAEAYRKRGQAVEALELIRRAAVQEDSTLGWLHLAKELRMSACYEQAAAVLYRLCGRSDLPNEVWLELGRCLAAMDRREAACDSLYHFLHEDPYSDAADQARDLLADLEEVPESKEPFRLNLLVRRALLSYRKGDRALGERRLRRAILIGENKTKLYTTQAMLALAEDQQQDALLALAHALKQDNAQSEPRCMMAVTLSAMGKKRMARGVLAACIPEIHTPRQEEQFLAAAWTIGANALAKKYLQNRLKQQPCRVALMHPMADLLWQEGEREQAMRWWKCVLAVDPENIRARAMVSWAPEHPEDDLPPMGALPGVFVRQQLGRMPELLHSGMPPEEMLRWGSWSRELLDWCFSMTDENLQETALKIAARQDAPCVRQYLHQLLTIPGVCQSVRQRAMMTLAERGDPGPMNVLLDTRITTAQLSPIRDTRQNLWKMFLGRLLQETRHTCQATEMAFFAADLWDGLTKEQRHAAAGPDCYLWVKGMETLYLQLTAGEDEAKRIVQMLPVSPRKISRVVRQLKRQMDISMEGESTL